MLFVLIMLLPLLLLTMLSSTAAYGAAEEGNSTKGLQIEAKVGYDGQYRLGDVAPVFVKLSNGLDRDISGDLVFNIRTDKGNTVSHIVPVEVVNGSQIQLTLNVDGYFDKKSNNFQFYEGGIKKGKLLSLVGDVQAIGKSVASTDMVGIIASNPDTLNFLLFLNQQNYDLTTVILQDNFEVSESESLNMFKVLVLNDVATSSWSEQKINAIKDWVIKGGTLLIGGGANYEQTAKVFEDIVPVHGQGSKQLVETAAIEDYALSDAPLDALQVSIGSLVRGEQLLTIGNNPILAHDTVGLGDIYYSAFDLGLKPFSTWEGRTSFIQSLLSETLIPNTMKPNYYYNNSNWAFDQAINFFPRLESPPVMFLMLLFAIYVFLIAPILYLILKKVDKREWAWWIIPVSAIISTVIVIYTGAINKTQNYLHHINVVEQIGDKTIVSGAGSLFLASNKDVSMEISGDQHLTFTTGSNNDTTTSLKGNKEYAIRYEGDHQELQWKSNKFWTTRSFTESPKVYDQEEYGQLKATIEKRDGSFVLHVENYTGVDLEHVSLLNGMNVEILGSLAKGDSTEIVLPQQLQFSESYLYRNSYGSQVLNNTTGNWDQYSRESTLLDNGSFIKSAINLVGFSYSEQSPYLVNNKEVKADQLTMWKVDLVDLIFEEMPGLQYITPTVMNGENAHFEIYNDSSFYLSEGSIQLNYQLKQGTSPDSVATLQPSPIDYNGRFDFSIYNERTQEWDSLTSSNIVLKDYMKENYSVLVKIETKSGQDGSIPSMLVEGEVR